MAIYQKDSGGKYNYQRANLANILSTEADKSSKEDMMVLEKQEEIRSKEKEIRELQLELKRQLEDLKVECEKTESFWNSHRFNSATCSASAL